MLFLSSPAKQTVLCERASKEISVEWSHHRISSTDSKVRTALHVSIIDSGNERVNPKWRPKCFLLAQQTPGQTFWRVLLNFSIAHVSRYRENRLP